MTIMQKKVGFQTEVKMIKHFFLILILISSSISTLVGQDINELKISPTYQFGGLEVDVQFQLYVPSDFIVTDNNEIIVCDSGENNIVIFNTEGRLIRKFGQLGQGPGDFSHPGKVGILGNDLIIYDKSNYRFQILTKSGEFLKIFPSYTLMELGAKMWVSKDGSYYFSTEGYMPYGICFPFVQEYFIVITVIAMPDHIVVIIDLRLFVLVFIFFIR